jgi:small basic protein
VSDYSRRGTPRNLVVWFPALGLLLGLLIGSVLSLSVPLPYSRYAAVGILAAMDSVLGALRAELEGTYRNRVFLSGFISNALLAVLLTYLGDRLGVELHLAAIVAFGVRLFNNLAIIRRRFL